MSKFSIILIVISGFILGAIFLTGLAFFQRKFTADNSKSSSSPTFQQAQISEKENSKILIYAVGDIMLNRGVEQKIKSKGKGDFKFPFLKIASELWKADILFGNLEGPISNKGKKSEGVYIFRMKPEAVEGLKYAGFNILSLANNHAFDSQRIGLEQTMDILQKNGIDYVGAGFNEKEASGPRIKELKGTKIGFLAYTDFGSKFWEPGKERAGVTRIQSKNLTKVKENIKNSKAKVDVLIVSLHSGYEYSKKPSSFQIKFAKTCIDAGADLVVGHHPHVIQPVEKYKHGWIAYSLGNFVFDQYFSEETMQGLLLEILIENKKIKGVNPKKFKISESFQPYLPRTKASLQKESKESKPSEKYLSGFEEMKENLIKEQRDFIEIDLEKMKGVLLFSRK